MILTIFAIFLFLSIACIIIGYITKSPPVCLGGYLFLFILGLVLLLGSLQYSNGETTNYNYACGCCNEHNFTLTSIDSYTCTGTPQDCYFYDGNEIDCLAAGCFYNDSLCYGNPLPCESFFTSRECELFGCYYNLTSEGEVCVNGTEKVITSQNKNITYSNYSGEIIQGLDVTHIFGFFLILLAVFGWIITLTNLDRFDDKQDAYKEYRRGGNNGEE